MATVYLAEDTKHARLVALKVLHPEFAASLGPDRFRREITLAARLQHPNIVTVFDSGETATGQLWFTMPYVVGESLRERLRRERQLSVEDTVRITGAIAGALQYAHGQGIIHRDVKPENILLSGDTALLADFGVARALPAGDEAAKRDGRTSLTQTGFTVGTPAYMSPEQASGERKLDGRSDEYSLAKVAYEMLAAEPPFSAPTPQAAIAKMLANPAPSIRVVRNDVPIGVDAALRKALGTAPVARYATIGAFGTALEQGLQTGTVEVRRRPRLRAVLIGIAALVIVAGAAAIYLRVGHSASPTMLAVLPFDTEGDTADRWITDGITDDVRGKLAGLSGLRVIARASSNSYRHSTKRPEEIGRELGVRYLLMGRIRWTDGAGSTRRVRVEPELIQVADVKTAQTTWEEPFDEEQADVYKLQSNIAERVAVALQVALNPAERLAITEPSTRNPDAYMAYLRGSALSQTSVPDDEARARAEFRRAVTLDSTFTTAWAALSVNITRWLARHPSTSAFDDSARTAAERALAIDPNSSRGTDALGFYYEIVKHDMRRAYTGYRDAAAREPSNGVWLNSLAGVEIRLGMWDSAIVHSEHAAQLNPRSYGYQNFLGNAYTLVRRYPDARRACERAAELNPNNMLTVFCLIQIPLAEGDLAGARRIVRAASPGIDSMAVYAFLSSYGAYTWVLDESQKRAVLTLPPNAFDRGEGSRKFIRMLIYDELGDAHSSKTYADSAVAAFQADNGGAAADSEPNYGLALAYAGRRADAIAAGDHYLAARPIDHDFLDGPDDGEAIAKAYTRADATDKALDLLERLLGMPGRLSPGRLRIDPSFAPLRDNPRFKRLVTSHGAGE